MTDKAVAIKYREDLPAPFLVAKGRDALAKRIVALAEEHGIKIVERRELTDRLFLLEPGSFIPEECFEVVARLLAYVHSVHTNREMETE